MEISKVSTEYGIKMERVILSHMPRHPKTLYDIGVGDKTEYFTLRDAYPGLKCFGCEPSPTTYQAVKSIFPGRLDQVAVDDIPGEATLYLGDQSNNDSFYRLLSKHSEVAKVQCVTLDMLDEEWGFAEDVILWMDIEGVELRALRGAKRLLGSGRVLAINLEVRDVVECPGWCTATEINAELTQYGYRLVKKYNDNTTHWDVIYTK